MNKLFICFGGATVSVIGSLVSYFSWDLVTLLSLKTIERVVINGNVGITIQDNNNESSTTKKLEFVALAEQKDIGNAKLWQCHIEIIPVDENSFEENKVTIKTQLKAELESYFPLKTSTRQQLSWRRGLIDSCSKGRTSPAEKQEHITAKIVVKFKKEENNNWKIVENDKKNLLNGSLKKIEI